MDNQRDTHGLITACVATLVFIVLKLVGVINWSWWWVMSPILFAFVVDTIVVVGMIIYISYDRKKRGIPSKKQGGKKNA